MCKATDTAICMSGSMSKCQRISRPPRNPSCRNLPSYVTAKRVPSAKASSKKRKISFSSAALSLHDMHRFYFPDAIGQAGTLVLYGSEAHHALHVLRVRSGERVAVLDGKGHEYSCGVQKSDRQSLQLSILETKQHPPPRCRITLLQAIPKG